jgi:hypothetical protein
LTIGIEIQHCPGREERKYGNVQRHTIVKDSATGLEQGLVIAREGDRYSGAGSGVCGTGNRVMIHPNTVIDGYALQRRPFV